MERLKKYDKQRCYAARCPRCHLFMNISGESLLKDERVRCRNCNTISKASTWAKETRNGYTREKNEHTR